MNTNSRTKRGVAGCLLMALFALAPLCNINAQESDDFGVWATFEASKKINKKFKAGIDAEVRTMDAVNSLERIAVGAKIDYKICSFNDFGYKDSDKFELKANVGYIFFHNQYPESKSIKWDEPTYSGEDILYGYNIDHAYSALRNRVYITLSGEYKIGRFEIGLRERLQYTHTSAATTNETKYRWECTDILNEIYELGSETEPELKEAKDNLSLRSRLNIKYDIPNCKINPFASVELYTRLDEWKGYDKMRYRIGGSYKINKKNSISLYYLYEDVNDIEEPGTHAVGLEYSIDL
jgi:hypothetical protein